MNDNRQPPMEDRDDVASLLRLAGKRHAVPRERAERVRLRLGAGSRAEALAFLAGDPREDEDLDTLHRVVSCRSVAADGAWRSQPPDAAGTQVTRAAGCSDDQRRHHDTSDA